MAQNRNAPKHPATMPNDRHFLAKKGKALVKSTTTLIEPGIDVQADLDAINRGLAMGDGDLFTANGRTYRVDGQDHTYPVQGRGFHRVDRATFKASQVL